MWWGNIRISSPQKLTQYLLVLCAELVSIISHCAVIARPQEKYHRAVLLSAERPGYCDSSLNLETLRHCWWTWSVRNAYVDAAFDSVVSNFFLPFHHHLRLYAHSCPWLPPPIPHNAPLISLPSPVKRPQVPLTCLQHPQHATSSGSSSNHQTHLWAGLYGFESYRVHVNSGMCLHLPASVLSRAFTLSTHIRFLEA